LAKPSSTKPYTLDDLKKELKTRYRIYQVDKNCGTDRSLNRARGTNKDEVGLYTNEGSSKGKCGKNSWKNSKARCQHCKKPGHRSEDCYHKPQAKSPPKTQNSPKKGNTKTQFKFKGRCNWCNIEGHKVGDCRKKANGEPQSVEAIARVGRKSGDQANVTSESEHILYCSECAPDETVREDTIELEGAMSYEDAIESTSLSFELVEKESKKRAWEATEEKALILWPRQSR